MTGCDRCGAQALAGEQACPVCGLALRAGAAGGRPAPEIPVRRYGSVPPPPAHVLPPAQDTHLLDMMALGLGALGVGLIACGLGYWLW